MAWSWHKRLFVRLLLGGLALVFLVAVPLSMLAVSKLRETQISRLMAEAREASNELGDAILLASRLERQGTFQKIAENTATNNGMDAVFLVGPDGVVLAHSDRSQVSTLYDPADYLPEYLDYERRVASESTGFVGSAHAGVLQSRVEEYLSSSFTMRALILALSALAGAGLALVLSSSTARPLRQLAQAARTISDGNCESSVSDVRGPLEVEEMARTFEEMRLALHDHVLRLEREHKELDRKVRDLTLLPQVSAAITSQHMPEETIDAGLSAVLQVVTHNPAAPTL